MAWEGGLAHVVGGCQHHLRRGRQRRDRELRDHARQRSRGARDVRGDAHALDLGSTTIITPAATGSVVSIDTTPSTTFGPIGQDLNPHKGHPLSTVIHEIGHIIGIGHGGPYNAEVNNAVQQYSAYDMTMWTLMSYIGPTEDDAKYFGEYPVTGTAWDRLGVLSRR